MDDYPRPPEYYVHVDDELPAGPGLPRRCPEGRHGPVLLRGPVQQLRLRDRWISIITMICAWSEAFGRADFGLRCSGVPPLKVLKTCLPTWSPVTVEKRRERSRRSWSSSSMVFIFGLLGMMFFANQLRFDGNTEAKIAFSVLIMVRRRPGPRGPHEGRRGWGETADPDRPPAWLDAAPGLIGQCSTTLYQMIAIFGILTGES